MWHPAPRAQQRAWPRGAGLSAGAARSGLSWGGLAWLGSARVSPSSPYMEIFPAARRARCSPESCPRPGAERLGDPSHPGGPAGLGGAASPPRKPSAPSPNSPWLGRPGSPIPTDPTPLGSPQCKGTPPPFPAVQGGSSQDVGLGYLALQHPRTGAGGSLPVPSFTQGWGSLLASP